MIFIHIPSPECLFVRVRKTATTSILRGCFEVVPSDENTSLEIRPQWRNLFRFAFVRNPFDRLVSAWQMFREYPKRPDYWRENELSILDVLRLIEQPDLEIDSDRFESKIKLHVLPMTSTVYQLNSCNFIGRFESIEADWQALAKELGPLPALGHLRNSKRKTHYSEYFDVGSRKEAQRILKQDAETFGYRFESSMA